MTYHWVVIKSSMTYATGGAGTAYPSGAPEFILVISGVRYARSLVFCVVLCRSLLVLLAIVLSVLLQYTDSDFGIIKLLKLRSKLLAAFSALIKT